jgi:hypothetical protein
LIEKPEQSIGAIFNTVVRDRSGRAFQSTVSRIVVRVGWVNACMVASDWRVRVVFGDALLPAPSIPAPPVVDEITAQLVVEPRPELDSRPAVELPLELDRLPEQEGERLVEVGGLELDRRSSKGLP